MRQELRELQVQQALRVLLAQRVQWAQRALQETEVRQELRELQVQQEHEVQQALRVLLAQRVQ